jgi:hypothetical protein
MRSKLLFLVSGMVLGAVLMLVIRMTQQPAAPPPSPPAADDRKVELEVKKAVAQVSNRMQQLEDENARLMAQLTQLRTTAAATNSAPAKQVSPWVKMFGSGSDANRAGVMSKMIKAAMQQQVEMKISGLKSRLHLSDEQEQSVRGLLEKQSEVAGAAAAKMFEGNASKDDLSRQASSAGDVKGQIKELLTPDQQAEYEKFQSEERQTQAQMVANVELSQLQSMLQLTQQQQDQVFQVLYDQAQRNVAQTDGGMQVPPDWDKLLDAKKKALRPVLTAEQLQSYEKFLNAQRDMMKAFMPVDENSGTGAVHGTVTISLEPAP